MMTTDDKRHIIIIISIILFLAIGKKSMVSRQGEYHLSIQLNGSSPWQQININLCVGIIQSAFLFTCSPKKVFYFFGILFHFSFQCQSTSVVLYFLFYSRLVLLFGLSLVVEKPDVSRVMMMITTLTYRSLLFIASKLFQTFQFCCLTCQKCYPYFFRQVLVSRCCGAYGTLNGGGLTDRAFSRQHSMH